MELVTNSNLVTFSESQMFSSESTGNFMQRLATLVAAIYATFSQISQNDRHEIARLEQKYSELIHKSADATIAQGSVAMKTAFISLGVFACSLAIGNQNKALFVQEISKQIPEISSLFSQTQAANQRIFDGMASIEQHKLQDTTSHLQSDGNLKEAFAQVLQAEIQRMRSAASSNQ